MAMFRSGVLVLPRIPQLASLKKILAEASKCVSRTLYVDLINLQQAEDVEQSKPITHPVLNEQQYIQTRIHYDLMQKIYSSSTGLCGDIDVRVLLPPITPTLSRGSRFCPFQLCIANTSSITNVSEFEHLTSCRYEFLNNSFHIKYIPVFDEFGEPEMDSDSNIPLPAQYPGVVIGGTFDRIHAGHKMLMGVAALLATEKVTVGVSDEPLLKRKILKELMQSTEDRIGSVRSFFDDIRPGLELKVVPLDDPAGPSGTDDDIQLLVLTQETLNGGDHVNQIRRQNSLNDLDVFVLDILEDPTTDMANNIQNEEKISSSLKRARELGKLLRPARRQLSVGNPYIIGLTGGIASGKTSISKRLEILGAAIINCDALGHGVYMSGTNAYVKVIETFGKIILNKDGEVDRKKLGTIVFNDKNELSKLNEIIWPEIAKLVLEEIHQFKLQGISVVVIEAAVLLEAGWDDLVNEIWVSFIPEDEAIERIMNRNNLTEQQALIRVQSQISNKKRLEQANVALSTLWEAEFTQMQVEKAWTGLRNRLMKLSSSM